MDSHMYAIAAAAAAAALPAAAAVLVQVGALPLVEFLSAQVPPDVSAAAAEGWKRERTEAALAAAR